MNFIKKFTQSSNIQINDIKFDYSNTFTKKILNLIDSVYLPAKELQSDKEPA